jgi:hypothetical protein
MEPLKKVLHLTLYGSQEKTDNICHHILELNMPQSSAKTSREVKKYTAMQWNMERIKVSRRDYRELLQFARTLTSLEDIYLKIRIQATLKDPFYMIPASHLRGGMVVPVLEDGHITEEEIIKIIFCDYNGNMIRYRHKSHFCFFFNSVLFATDLME